MITNNYSSVRHLLYLYSLILEGNLSLSGSFGLHISWFLLLIFSASSTYWITTRQMCSIQWTRSFIDMTFTTNTKVYHSLECWFIFRLCVRFNAHFNQSFLKQPVLSFHFTDEQTNFSHEKGDERIK